jgi:hypothetical protein
MQLVLSCKTENFTLKALDGFQENKYYSTDIVPENFCDIYGIWKVDRTSGGFSGMGYNIDFDYLIIKKNAIFGIVRNDSLIAYGKLTLLLDNPLNLNNSLLCKFDFDQNNNIQLSRDADKYISITNKDTLNLTAPCCDRYNTQLVRQISGLNNSGKTGTLEVKISIGPLCPVQTNPPLPGCVPTSETYKAWQTSIWNSTKTQKITDIIPNLDGSYQIELYEGQYIIDFKNTIQNQIGSNNLPIKFNISNSKITNLNINIDTGIR